MAKSGAMLSFATVNEASMNSMLAWIYIIALARRANLRRIGAPIVVTSVTLEAD